MLLPLSWLKQFVKIDATAEQIAAKLTLSGSEVEKIVRCDAGLSKVIVGQIKDIKPHPNADKLRLAYVDIGKGKLLEIVCGGNNIEAGQKVPVVLLGGSVPGNKIELRDIRGVKSQGMLAGYDELVPHDDHLGIFILPADAKIGTDVVELLELDDSILELEITPNRADCFSVRGLAREVAALFGRKIQDTRYKIQESKKSASSVLKVEVKDSQLCPKYTARVIENVTIKPSPQWLQNRLRQAGIKSINNVVDVTNYVMMELGQPLHAFDADLLGANIIVRPAKSGEEIMALDENVYKLNSANLVIADNKKPVAIAGVMGGQATAVHDGTKRIVLEAAVFDAVSVRKTSRALGLRSESSMRFEKGVDFAAVEEASNRAAAMIAELAGGTVLKGIISAGQKFDSMPAIKISLSEITNLLGTDVPAARIKSILASLGFGVAGSGGNLTIKVPSWRADVTQARPSAPASGGQAADIVEEIGRLLDYNTLPKTLPSGALQSPRPAAGHELRRGWRQFLSSAGYSEILTYSFYDEKLLALSGVPEGKHGLVTNPVSAENKYLRANLLPAMLAKLSQNSALLARDQFQLFEIGKVFAQPHSEKWQLAVGLIDVTASDEVLYRRLRGLSANGAITIYPKGSVPNLRLRSSVGVLLVDLDEAIKNDFNEPQAFRPLPYYPLVERDLAMIVPAAVQYKQIAEAMAKFDPLLKAVALFDVYHGLGEGTSLAFRLTFGSTDRTLAAKEVDEVMAKLKTALQKKFAISFR